jgi:hypothetical protein|tara:strand:- start:402 stop:599 length:198 start_codon:yes stop_codon:yes gene_type:complete
MTTQQQRMQIQLDKQDSQIEDLFKSVREIKNMNIKVISGFKGLLIGFALMVGVDFGIGDLLMKLL